VHEAGRGEVHHLRLQLLPAGAHHQRRRQRLHPVHVGEGRQHRVDRDDAELGRTVAVQLGARRRAALLRGHLHRRPDAVHEQHRAGVVDLRHDVRQQQPVCLLIVS
jgi:hypothetical protein